MCGVKGERKKCTFYVMSLLCDWTGIVGVWGFWILMDFVLVFKSVVFKARLWQCIVG